MAQQEEIVLWIDRRWKNAIEKHLKDETLQEHLENVLDELCNQLPQREYERISRADHFRIIGDMRVTTYMGKPAFNALQIAFAVIYDRDHASAPLVLGSWSAARGSISSA